MIMTESGVFTDCLVCGRHQNLAQASVDLSDDMETVYSCVNGCGPILLLTLRRAGTTEMGRFTPAVAQPSGAFYYRSSADHKEIWMVLMPANLEILLLGNEKPVVLQGTGEPLVPS